MLQFDSRWRQYDDETPIIQIDHSRGSISQITYGMMEKIIGQFKLMGVHKDAKLKDVKEKPVFIAKNVKKIIFLE